MGDRGVEIKKCSFSMFLPDVPVAREIGSWGWREQWGYPHSAGQPTRAMDTPPSTDTAALWEAVVCTCLCLWSGEVLCFSSWEDGKGEKYPSFHHAHPWLLEGCPAREVPKRGP